MRPHPCEGCALPLSYAPACGITAGQGRAFATGQRPAGADADAAPSLEVRGFASPVGVTEDPVTGSLNAGLAQWLLGSGRATSPYLASQGTAIGHAGRVHVEQIGADIWIGGASITVIAGSVTI